ncbi:MAG: zinc metalloprotease HtpX [Alphaproteobacteria bacterium]|nr:zinc metalloprotease HtpX [Alphaproteobacteria bacterium]
MSLFRTGLLMAFLTGLFVAVGYVIGGGWGMIMAVLFAAGTNLFAYWNSDRMVLSMYGAREVDETTAPELVHIVRRLAEADGLPMPRGYIAENDQPNAFATGRNPQHTAVCATTGLLQRLNSEELAGVLAHELSHVKNRDTLIMTIVATIGGAIGMLANLTFFMGGDRRGNPLGPLGAILVAILAPVMAMLVQMGISRTREFEADHSGAILSGRPLWLASALRRIESAVEEIGNPEAQVHPATAHMFIISPLHGGGLSSLFASHPSTEERIARLQAMAAELGQTPKPGPWG